MEQRQEANPGLLQDVSAEIELTHFLIHQIWMLFEVFGNQAGLVKAHAAEMFLFPVD